MSQRRQTDRTENESVLTWFETGVSRLPLGERLLAGSRQFSTTRAGALSGCLCLIGSFLLVLYDVVQTAGSGSTLLFYPAVLLPFVGATVLARSVRIRVAIAIGCGLLAVGLGWHLYSLEEIPSLWPMIGSNIELLTGREVKQIIKADIWALGVAPTPVFITWYLALRREYTASAVAGGATLSYFVLTGDAGSTITLFGVVGVALLVGFGDLDAGDWSRDTVDYVAMVLGLMVVTPFVITIVPGGAATPVTFVGSEQQTVEQSLVGTDADLDVVGSVEQSPAVRFTVTSEQARYWRTGSFDRYTGSGWVRTGGEQPYDQANLDKPPGQTTQLVQTVEVESKLTSLPAAWRPIKVSSDIAGKTKVTANDGLRIDGTLDSGDSYQVLSAVTDPTTQQLKTAGKAYPEQIKRRYTQLPESTPQRVTERTSTLTANATTPYETARTITVWLRENREYSLDVDKPEGSIADAFLFEMEKGYCTYYATTMVTMLRTQDIPARLAVGYNGGQPVGEDKYVVRGLNSHAWVEVYFPEIGWVPFDPTPPDQREQQEQAAIQNARAEGSDTVDTEASEPDGNVSDSPSVLTPTNTSENVTAGSQGAGQGLDPAVSQVTQRGPENTVNTTDTQATPADSGTTATPTPGLGNDTDSSPIPSLPSLPPRDQLALGLIAMIGAVAGVRQSTVTRRLSRWVRIRYQRRRDPETDIERAYQRLLLLLEHRHRPQKTGETSRQYLDSIVADPRAKRVATLRERAQYADEISKSAADEAVSLVESIREDW